jgi:acid phosphatase (class A)
MPGRLASIFRCVIIVSGGAYGAACQGATSSTTSSVTAAPAAAPTLARAATVATAAPGKTGFLRPDERPDALGLIPAPPVPGSSRMAADEEIYRESVRWRGTARWRLAMLDANVQFPQAASVFACAAAINVSQQATPQLYLLLQRTVIDAGKSTLAAKQKYQRPRPFAVFDDAMCLPEQAAALRRNDAFPSGHASLGWAWALILAELVPDRADAIFRRGYEFGQSRVVCGLHWQSDVDAGRLIGAAVVARLHGNAQFTTALQAARRETTEARNSSAEHAVDCEAERAALAAAVPTASPYNQGAYE